MSFSVVSLLRSSVAEAVAQAQDLSASLAQLPPHAHAERSRIHALRACVLHEIDPSAAREAAVAAHSEAQAAGDDRSVGWSLLAGCVAPSPGSSLEQRLANGEEALLIARNSRDRELLSGAYFLLLVELAESGAMAELDRVLNPAGALLTAAPWLEDDEATMRFRCLRAILDGQTDRAEAIIKAGQSAAPPAERPGGQSLWLGPLAVICWLQDRSGELESLVLEARQNAPNEHFWAVHLAWVWAQQGRRIAASALLETIPPADTLIRDRNWLATLSLFASVSAELGDRHRAALLRTTLRPFRDRLIMMGSSVTCLGTVHLPLARLSLLLGDDDEAIDHYRAGIAFTAKLGAHPWLAEAQIGLAGLLLQRDDPAGAQEAETLAAEALAAARSLRLRRLEELAASLLASIRRHRDRDARGVDSPDPDARPAIRILGAFDTISVQGEPVRWQSKKARELLKILVARRGAPITRERLIDLLWPDEQIDRLNNRLAVAISTIRRALDSATEFSPNTFVETRGDVVRVNTRLIEIDAESFMSAVRAALKPTTDAPTRIDLLTTALDSYEGDVLIDEPDEPWVLHYRREVHDAFLEAAYALALAASEQGDHLSRIDAYRRILRFDVYERRAHEGLIHALTAIGAHGQAASAEADYAQYMQDLGIEVGQDRLTS